VQIGSADTLKPRKPNISNSLIGSHIINDFCLRIKAPEDKVLLQKPRVKNLATLPLKKPENNYKDKEKRKE
jgi:hypothetical protein